VRVKPPGLVEFRFKDKVRIERRKSARSPSPRREEIYRAVEDVLGVRYFNVYTDRKPFAWIVDRVEFVPKRHQKTAYAIHPPDTPKPGGHAYITAVNPDAGVLAQYSTIFALLLDEGYPVAVAFGKGAVHSHVYSLFRVLHPEDVPVLVAFRRRNRVVVRELKERYGQPIMGERILTFYGPVHKSSSAAYEFLTELKDELGV